jgi:CheY-like chemotaxis protein
MSEAAKTVLIVDDHPAFRASARLLLESEGYDVVGEAGDGASALAATAEQSPDVVLLDVQLPDIDGFEVAERIEANPEIAPQIVLVSSRDASDFGALLDNTSIRGFISKGDLSGAAIAELLS